MLEYLLNIAAVISGIVLIAYVIRNNKKHRMTEAQSLAWIASGSVIIILGVAPNLIVMLAGLLGIWYAPTVVYLIGIAALVLITIQHTTTISKLTNEMSELAITVSLLKHENERMAALLDNSVLVKKPS